jgi:DNA repair exonuclease SbcCD ATPase subunit
MGSEQEQVRREGEVAAESAGAEDVFQVLAEFERGLAGLTKLYEQRQQLQEALQARLGAVEEREARSRERAEAIERLERELTRQAEEMTRAQAEIGADRARLAELSRTLEAEAAAIREQRRSMEQALAELEAQRRSREEESRRLAEQVAAAKAEMARLQGVLADREAALESRRAEWERQAASRAAETDALREAAASASRLADESRTRLEEQQQRYDELQARFEEERARAAEEHARLQAREREQQAAIAELSAQVDRARIGIEELTARLSQAEAQAAAARKDAEQQREQAAALQARCARAEKALQDFQAQMAGDAAAAAEPLARLSRELEEAAAERDDLRRRLAEATERIKTVESRRAEEHQVAAQAAQAREKELRALRERVATLEAELSQAVAPGGTPGGVSDPKEVSRLALRRRRLAQYRRALESHAAKVRKAGEALQRRYELCEQVLAQRAELAAAKQSLAEAHAAIERRRAGGRALGVVCFLVLTLATLGGASWALAWSLFPGTYIASVTLRADNPSRTLGDAELAEWTRYHAERLADPQFVAAAAERMQARGIASLASPGALAARLEADLRHGSVEPGSITLEWTGKGSSATARELTQVAAALASFANDRRFTRADGAATRVDGEVAVVGPFDNSRLLGAAGIFAVLSVLVLGLIALAWHRLASAKTMFENEAALNEILDDNRWPDLKGS